jgi:hypothetical protein
MGLCSVLGRQDERHEMTNKNLTYMERILVASTHRGDGMFIGILMPEIQHDTWCKQLNQKGICNCEPDIFIETNDGRFEINMQGKLEKIV